MKARIIFAVLFCLVAAVPNAVSAQKRTLLRLSFSSGWDALPAVVAIERGFFAQQGLVVSGMAVSSPVGVMQSLAAGSTDFATVPQRTMLIMAGAKVPVTVVSMNGYGRQMELVVPPRDKRTKSLAQLKGKIVAVGASSEAHPVLIRLLNAARLRPTDVVILQLKSRELADAFRKKGILVRSGKRRRRVRVAAVFATRHFTSRLITKYKARVVLANDAVTKGIGRIGAAPLVVNRALLKKQPGQVQKFVNAWVRALVYIQKDPEDAARLLQIFFHRQGTKVPTKVAKSWVGMVSYDRYTWSKNDISDAEYNGWGLKTGGIFKFAPKLDGYIDNSFAKKALAGLKRKSKTAPGKAPKAGKVVPPKKKAGAN